MNAFPTTSSHPTRLALLLSLLGAAPIAFGQTPTATFAPVVTYVTGTGSPNPTGIAVADVNKDGRPDALLTNNAIGTLSVLLGNGSGGFTLRTPSVATGGVDSSPTGIAIADVNGVSNLDALVADLNYSTVSILLGNGSGGFTLQANPPAAGANPLNLAVADVSGDGKLDVVVTNYGTNTLTVLLGNGSGGFTRQPNATAIGTGTNPSACLTLVDVSGDGKPDALVSNYNANTVEVLLGNGSGGFTLQPSAPTTGSNSGPYGVAMGDVNADGNLDAVTVTRQTNTLVVLLGNGNGGFTRQATSFSTGTGSTPTGMALADVNGDGKLDAVTTNTASNTVSILLGNGAGTFTRQTVSPSTGAGSYPFSLVVTDVNGDSKRDILVVNEDSNTLGVLLNTSTFLATRAALSGANATLSPNPVHASTTLTATGLPTVTRTLDASLLSSTGQVVRRLGVPAALGVVQASVFTAGLVPGLYVLRLSALDAQGTELGTLPTQRLSVVE